MEEKDKGEDEQFERDLKNMLKDGPSISPTADTVQGDLSTSTNPMSMPSTSVPRSASGPIQGRLPDAASVPHSPSVNGHSSSVTQLNLNSSSKLDAIKDWSISTFKCTKQLISEKFGNSSRTVDVELESQIEVLRDTQRRYSNLLRLARLLANQLSGVFTTQRVMSEAFSDLAQKSLELQEEFASNSETQKNLAKSGESLIGALNFFISGINTLTHKTMEDTLQTIRNYETARVEYDAYRLDVESLQLRPRDATTMQKLKEAENKHAYHKAKFERLRGDVSIKMRFLDENRVKVMQKQLLLFHNAVSHYHTGNVVALEKTMKQFSIKLKTPNSSNPSWLEQS
ncbi:DgyrCDS5199 [Dimorphilus gyrociliatus]|uniref:DgyrCDS5199 n=1 Tax=Dimorphilus gyrociliatus TaxID=2664684 RepID=A0A7I8VJ32_9ANNE|nr:DgyrCDS5199 [Dimorphilus gyrociliatus]